MYVTNLECVDGIIDLLNNANPSLDLAYISDSPERLLPKYPAVLVTSGPKVRTLHGTHTFGLNLNVIIWVYHAKVSDTKRQRERSDEELCSLIEDVIHGDTTLGQNIIFGYVDSIQPGMVATPKKVAVIGSRMTWTAVSQEHF